MITWIASYPKSGNTWVRFLIHNVLHEPTDDLAVIEQTMPYVLRVGDGYRTEAGRDDLLKTHLSWSADHPLGGHSARAIYIVRDPRDVLLSNLNYRAHRRGGGEADARAIAMSEEEYAHAFIAHGGEPAWAHDAVGTWAANTRSWTGDTGFPVLIVRYEDLEKNTRRQLTRILAFLGVSPGRGAIKRAVRTSGFGVLREAEIRRREAQGWDVESLFFNAGRSGRSLDELVAPGLDAAFDKAFGEDLARFGYAARARR